MSVVVVWMMALAGCQHGSRSNSTGTEQDSTALAEIFEFQRKAYKAENDVIAIVKADTGRQWVQYEFGWWYHYTHKSEEHDEDVFIYEVKKPDYPIHETVYTLDGSELIVDAIREFDVPEGERGFSDTEPFAYQIMLREMVPNDTAILLIPWTLAYGKEGNEHVPPYTSVRVQLTLHTDGGCDAEMTEE